jgi:hypothetical protein
LITSRVSGHVVPLHCRGDGGRNGGTERRGAAALCRVLQIDRLGGEVRSEQAGQLVQDARLAHRPGAVQQRRRARAAAEDGGLDLAGDVLAGDDDLPLLLLAGRAEDERVGDLAPGGRGDCSTNRAALSKRGTPTATSAGIRWTCVEFHRRT